MDENRDLRVRQHFERLAAKEKSRCAAAPMRCHYDQIAAPRLRGLDDCPIRILVFHVNRFTLHPLCLRSRRDGVEGLGRMGPHAFPVLGRQRLDHLAPIQREYVKRCRNRQGDDPRANRLAKEMPLATALPARSEPSVGINIVLYMSRVVDRSA